MLKENHRSGMDFLLQYHMPLILLAILAYLFSPWRLATAHHFLEKGVAVAPFLMIAGLILAWTFDRLAENARGPSRELPEIPDRRHVALFLMLPLSSSGIFLFIHPGLGLLLTLASFVLSFVYAIDVMGWVHGFTRTRSLTLLILAGLVYLIPLAILLLINNIWMSLDILRDTGVL